MKRFLVLGLCILGFVLIAAPTAVEFYPVYLNGKLLGNARNINGVIAISVADLAKASGGTLTLEDAGLTITGNTLSTVNANNVAIKKSTLEHKHKEGAYKEQAAIKGELKIQSPQLFRVNKPGAITTHMLTLEGQKWVPLADFANAFGGVWKPQGNLRPSESISLNFSKVQFSNGILVGL